MNNAGLRETDILLWAEHQADPFRRRASNELAWGNTADGIESVGRSELHAVQSLLAQAVRYWLKAEAWPTVRDAPNWRVEAIRFRGDAADRFTPSMRQNIEMARISRRALRNAGINGRAGEAAGAGHLPGHI